MHGKKGIPAAAAALALSLLAAGPLPPASAQEAAPVLGARDFFKGRILSYEGRRISIEYDFSKPEQAEDWRAVWPFQKPNTSGNWRVDAGALRGDGNVAFRHLGVFERDVTLEATLSCEDARNFGAVVLSEDSTTFTMFVLADTTFTLLDRRQPLEHQVTTFLPAGTGPGGTTFWRYVETSYEPRIGTAAFDMVVKKRGPENWFRYGTGTLRGKDVEATVGPRLAAAFFTIGSRVVVKKAKVSGVLDAAWLKKSNIDFEDRVPVDPDPIPGVTNGGESPLPTGPSTAEKAPDPGSKGWMELVRVVSDASKPKEAREAAADALVEQKERLAVRPMIDLLYDQDDDDPVGREVAIRVFKGIVGKDAGYRADAPRDYRIKVMPRIWEYWYALREQIDKDR